MIKEIKKAIDELHLFGNALGNSEQPSIIIDAIYKKFENTQEKKNEILKNIHDLRMRGELDFDKENNTLIWLFPKFFAPTK